MDGDYYTNPTQNYITQNNPSTPIIIALIVIIIIAIVESIALIVIVPQYLDLTGGEDIYLDDDIDTILMEFEESSAYNDEVNIGE